MKLRALVAKMDGEPGADKRALAPGCIVPAIVPVTIDFDHTRCVGSAAISIDGTDVYADFDVRDGETLVGLTPAIAFRSRDTRVNTFPQVGVVTFHNIEVMTIGLTSRPNADPRIPPIA